jgi:D-glycero-alpha-D-manno-heptose 1-phosphate guanylyltransferase
MEAIILAGGFGTRLQSVVPDLPKPMAAIQGRPFLAILLDALITAGFTSAILAVGYRYEAIRDYFGETYNSLSLAYSIETEPLGTGGAIALALKQIAGSQCFVVNGDTFLELDYQAMLANHLEERSILTVAVHEVPDANRYGALDIEENRILGFFEKGSSGPGIINGGVYVLSTDLFSRYDFPTAFSFETDLLMVHVHELKPLAFPTAGFFIDIGVPEDYHRAQNLFTSPQPK